MAKTKPQPPSAYVLMVLIIFQGLSGLLGGVGLVLDPTGTTLQLPIGWLENSPFNDYLIPGLILLSVLGIFPLIIFFGLLRQFGWSWFGALIIGIGLLIWIAVEILIIGYQPQPPLQLIYGMVGLLILVMVLLPSVQKYFK